MEGNGNQTTIADQHRQWDDFVATWVRASRGGETVVLGDFNIDFVTWAGNNPRPQDSHFWSEIVDKVIPNNFTQIINTPTRYHKPTDTHTILDHIWVNCPTKVVCFNTKPWCGSDHRLVICKLSTRKVQLPQTEVKRRDIKDFTDAKFRQRLQNVDWTTLYNSDCPNFIAQHLSN